MRLSRDAGVVGVVLAWIAVVLLLEAATAGTGTVRQQVVLGGATWLVLLGLLRAETPQVRAQVAVVVAFATSVEYLFSAWLGTYEYRLGTVPMFVPPGHGLVYLAAVAFGRTAWAARRARALLAAMLALGGGWALWGLLLSPQPDALGAFWYGCLLLFAWRGRSPLVYVGAFAIVSYLEILGTSLGTWRWGSVDPVLGLVTIGNPPSGIAGGYAWFDAAALTVAPVLLRSWAGRGRARRPAARTASLHPSGAADAYRCDMARPRHAKPSRLLDLLFPGRAARRRQALVRDCLLRQVAEELRHLRTVADARAAAVTAAQARADAAQAAVLELRREVARLREELLWAWAEGRVSGVESTPTTAGARVIDLRGA